MTCVSVRVRISNVPSANWLQNVNNNKLPFSAGDALPPTCPHKFEGKKNSFTSILTKLRFKNYVKKLHFMLKHQKCINFCLGGSFACITLIIRAHLLLFYCVQLSTRFSIPIHDVKKPANLVLINV